MSSLVAIHGSHKPRWIEPNEEWEDDDGGYVCIACGASDVHPETLEKPCLATLSPDQEQ